MKKYLQFVQKKLYLTRKGKRNESLQNVNNFSLRCDNTQYTSLFLNDKSHRILHIFLNNCKPPNQKVFSSVFSASEERASMRESTQAFGIKVPGFQTKISVYGSKFVSFK